MSRPILSDAFAHHAWATLRLIDACADLPPDRLDTAVPGTYGSIIDTLRHLVGADSWYLYRCSGERTRRIEDDEEASMDLAALRTAVTYYRSNVASHGGYVYYYSLDLSQRWGEGVATS